MLWFRVCLWWWSSFGLPVVLATATAATTCLQDGIPEDQRQNLTIDGVSMPLGVATGGWDSVDLVTRVYQILASEVLGYHVRTLSTANSLHQMLAVSGCSGQDLALCTWPPTEHLSFEAWATGIQIATWAAFSQLLGEASGSILGPVGYEGYDGLHVLGRANNKSEEAVGLHLTYYGDYNSAWFHPENYAAKISDVDPNKLRPCNITDEGYAFAARFYLEATGDVDGVEDRNGQRAYKCWLDEKWWLAPACRADPANCISIVSAGKGWGFPDITQKATFYNMNVGMAVASTFANYVAINTELQSLLYAWSPDSNFVAYQQLAVQFPERHDAEILQGIYRSMNARSTLFKLVAAGLEVAASRALGLAENLIFSSKDIEALLIQLVSADTKDTWQTACEWVKSNKESWEAWVPDRTTCAVGKGLVDLQDNFVTSKSEAVDCKMCSPGRVSVKFENTRVCSPCAPGSFQNAFGASECKLCEIGTMAANPGSRECDKCSLGLYANDTGMSFCYQCGADMGDEAGLWTTNEFVAGKIIELQGATAKSKCFCKEGWFLWQGRCQQCGDGLDCPGMNHLSLKRGYFSMSHAPNDVFHCLNEDCCPGGPAGTCAAGRHNQSIACNDCQDGLRDSGNGTCEECGGGDYAFFITVCFIIPIGVTCLYIGLKKETQRQSGSGSLMMTCSLQLLLVTVQMLSVMRRFDINWREPFASVLVFLEFLSFDLEMLSVSCVTSMGPVALFGLRSLVIPVLMFAILVVHLCFLLCTRSKTFQGSNLWRTMGTTFLVFFIVLFSMLLAPFQCHGHPNGTSTLKRYATVYCDGEGQHLAMFIIGGFACLMPVLFLAICTWVVLVHLPARLARSDAKCLESYSFLIRRFRPGAEIASVLFLVRNALVVPCPLATSTPGQLAMMNLIFYVNLIGVSFFKPWRSMSCNLLDCMLLFGMMVILDMGSVSVTDSNPAASMAMVMAFVVIMLLSILLNLLNGGYRYFQQKYRKQFRFFTCHQKNAAGSMARFLKMELELRNPGTKTFIDCDDLTDLTRLFSYVVQDTETFLILGSPAILTRKWCVGEMVTAHRNNVKTLLLSWPAFLKPDEKFIEHFPTLVPDYGELANHGIGLSDVAKTFRWLHTVASHNLPEKFTPSSAFPLVRMLCGQSLSACRMTTFYSTDCPVLANPEDTEAMATAMVLSSMLNPKLIGTRLPLTSVLEEGNDVLDGAQVALMICSSNCWKSAQVERWLLQTSQLPSCGVIPVIAQDNYLVPSPSMYEELRPTSLLDQQEFQRYCMVIKALFQEIAVVFVPQNYSSTHEDLLLRANQAAGRLQATLTPLAEKVRAIEDRDGYKHIAGIDKGVDLKEDDWKEDPFCGKTLSATL